MKRSKARVPFTSWCCNIVIGNGSRVMIMGVTYMFNIFIKIRASGTNRTPHKSQAKMTSGMDDNKEIRICKLYIYSNSPILRSHFVVPEQPFRF